MEPDSAEARNRDLPELSQPVFSLVRSIERAGGRALLVGGWVRDRLLGIHSKDLDIEVFGLQEEKLRKICRTFGRLMTVGEAFAVLKLTFDNGETIDISLPRRETPTGSGHRDFAVQADPFMTIEEAAQRRDLTINAISLEPLTGRYLDPVGGMLDIRRRCLRHIGPRFREDPLRVLRVYQFQARFGFGISPETRDLCADIAGSGILLMLPEERIEEELRKLMLRGYPDHILQAFRHMREDKVLHAVFPELDELGEIPQDPRYHTEGDVLEHTFRAVSHAASIALRDRLPVEDRWHLCMAALMHDLGKRDTTTIHPDGRITAHGHDEAGLEAAEKTLNRITRNVRTREVVLSLVKNHMRPLQLATAERVGNGAIRRLAIALQPSSIEMLCRLVEADTLASIRGDGKPHENAHVFLLDRARNLGVNRNPPEPLLQGRDLMQLARDHVIPERFAIGGVHFSDVLKNVYQKQLDGLFSDRAGAIEYIRSLNLD